jgi:hypothetical protein
MYLKCGLQVTAYPKFYNSVTSANRQIYEGESGTVYLYLTFLFTFFTRYK